jgi:hypothetical protein
LPKYVCVCGHYEVAHYDYFDKKYKNCNLCMGPGDGCQQVKLDNLSLIEDLAKERGLV